VFEYQWPANLLLIIVALGHYARTIPFPQHAPPSAQETLEFQRLFLLPSASRHCFVLRILFGMTMGNCSSILRLGIGETEEVLCAALRELRSSKLAAQFGKNARENTGRIKTLLPGLSPVF
jgi:hypothetical protein